MEVAIEVKKYPRASLEVRVKASHTSSTRQSNHFWQVSMIGLPVHTTDSVVLLRLSFVFAQREKYTILQNDKIWLY